VPGVEKKKRTKKQSRNEAGTGYRPKRKSASTQGKKS
jgi:hypothetical protein